MFNKIKEYFLSLITTRVIYLIVVFTALFSILVVRLFDLQIVHGNDYKDNFELKSKKERTINSTRGNIYDCNGVLLAYNELAYSVTIEDVIDSGKTKNEKLNKIIYNTIKIIEENGDKVLTDFAITLDKKGRYAFTLSGSRLNRFKADIYGKKYVDEMSYGESSVTAPEMMEYLAGENRYDIQIEGITKEKILQIVAIRYALSLNAYQKYISTTIADDVSDKTVAVIYENADILKGVSIAENTKRVYPNGIYTAQIVGYTGKISSEELADLQDDEQYSLNDIIGKTGIEKSMDSVLRGLKGSETIYVNTTGKVISIDDHVDPTAGNDIYLSIDAKWQEAMYDLLEQSLAGILLQKIVNTKEYKPTENSTAQDILIPIYDVYYALINNSVLDITHFSAPDASDAEKEVYAAFEKKKEDVLNKLKEELNEKHTPYNKLTVEYKVYENRVEDILLNKGILVNSKIDKEDPTYLAWYKDETISLYDYLNYAISQSWIDIDSLELETDYSESGEIFDAMVRIVSETLDTDILFEKQMFKYIVKNDNIKPRTILQCLIDQNVVKLSDEELASWNAGRISAYEFMIRRIENLEITPAQLALEPYAASMVITDIHTGKVKALVSYPSYDNNFLANGADSAYLAKINADLSMPLFNYATQQRTAPGSTYKMVSATAGLEEGVINLNTLITCTGSFTVTTDTHKCWVWPGHHGPLNVTGAINKSCNSFFYNVGYRLSLDENGVYNSELGIDKLNKYAGMYGLCDKSGVEIEEYAPNPTTKFSVPSAIGQGTNAFTTVGLARYVTAIANRGTVFDLTLLDKITDSNANVLVECKAEVKNEIDMKDSYWDAIQEGMRRVVADTSYFKELPFEAAGKTGTAQQSSSHPDHALFVSFAPFKDPQYSIAIRIANGYTSSYPSHVAKDAYKYIFNVGDKNDTITGSATDISNAGNSRD